MTLEQLSHAAQDCLKVIWRSGEWHDTPVTTSALATSLGVAPSTVSEMVRRLAAQGLVHHEPYAPIVLSDAGRELAVAVVRRHRLIETFLVEQLDYTWDEVHDEAEVLEHAVSDRLIDRIDAALGHPQRDPHGDPIPSAQGVVPSFRGTLLADVEEARSVRIARISDADPELLRYLTSVRVHIGAEVRVVERRAYAGVVRLAVAGGPDDVVVGDAAQRAIWVEEAAD